MHCALFLAVNSVLWTRATLAQGEGADLEGVHGSSKKKGLLQTPNNGVMK